MKRFIEGHNIHCSPIVAHPSEAKKGTMPNFAASLYRVRNRSRSNVSACAYTKPIKTKRIPDKLTAAPNTAVIMSFVSIVSGIVFRHQLKVNDLKTGEVVQKVANDRRRPAIQRFYKEMCGRYVCSYYRAQNLHIVGNDSIDGL